MRAQFRSSKRESPFCESTIRNQTNFRACRAHFYLPCHTEKVTDSTRRVDLIAEACSLLRTQTILDWILEVCHTGFVDAYLGTGTFSSYLPLSLQPIHTSSRAKPAGGPAQNQGTHQFLNVFFFQVNVGVAYR